LFLVLQENMESCQNHFWGTLNTSPPPKKSIFFQEQEISQEREFVASQFGDYKKMSLIVQTNLEGQSLCSPHLTPQIQCNAGQEIRTPKGRGHLSPL
jgi:hypothetical protein